jgi:non-ribosomal peptide synthetase component F
LHTARRNVALPAPLVDAVRDYAHQEGATLFMALQAAMMTVLRFYFGHDDVRVATDVANRNRPGTERLIGRLANTVVLRTDLSGDPTPREVMHRVRATTLAAFRNQELPFDEMTKSLGHNGRATRDLTGVMLSLQNATLRPATKSAHLGLEEAGPEILTPPVTMTAYDMILTLRESVRGLVGTCVYKPAVVQPHVIERLMRDFRFSLECMTTKPGLPISSMAAVVESRDSWSEAMQ